MLGLLLSIVVWLLPPVTVAVRVDLGLAQAWGGEQVSHVRDLVSGYSGVLERQAGLRLRLVHVEVIEADLPSELPGACEVVAGILEELEDAFVIAGADLHLVLSASQTGCGIASSESGYAIIGKMGADEEWDRFWFGHEVGHLLGASHVWEVAGEDDGTWMGYAPVVPGLAPEHRYAQESVEQIQVQAVMGVMN